MDKSIEHKIAVTEAKILILQDELQDLKKQKFDTEYQLLTVAQLFAVAEKTPDESIDYVRWYDGGMDWRSLHFCTKRGRIYKGESGLDDEKPNHRPHICKKSKAYRIFQSLLK